MSSTDRSRRIPRLGFLFLGVLILAAIPLACSGEAPAPPEEGSQVTGDMPAQEPTQEPAPAPEPAPAAEAPRKTAAAARPSAPPPAPRQPETVAVTVPETTTLKVKMEDALDSETSQPGDHFAATLLEAVIVGDRVALAAGSTIDGTLTDVIPAKKGIKDSGGALTLNFEKITIPSGETAVMSASLSRVAKSTKKKAGTIGGAAAGGALLGKILGGSTKDAAVGAVVGGAIGTGVAAGTKGTEMKIEAGSELTITLDQPLTVYLKR